MLWRRNASLAGGFAGRPVLVMCFVVCYDLPFAGISQVSCLPLFHCLCRYQDRATEHLRPNPRKKKIATKIAKNCKNDLNYENNQNLHAGCPGQFEEQSIFPLSALSVNSLVSFHILTKDHTE